MAKLGHKLSMIARTNQKNNVASIALYSDCEKYRYELTRVWGDSGKRVHFIMLNPSTATEIQNDPTVERCQRRAQALGFGAFRVTNIFAWRDTDPRAMRRAADPIGPENDGSIVKGCGWASQTICAWGTHGEHRDRGAEVVKFLKTTNCAFMHLGLTMAGHPKHPLYIAYAQQPEPWL